MANVICLMGESGSGKTTSCRNLDPKTTFYIDADRKGLSWRGWKQQYNKENKNYKKTSDVAEINKILRGISATCTNIKTVIIDTLNSIMVDDEMNRMREKGYDKWIDLATCVWDLVSSAHMLRDDLTIIFMAHTQTERDDTGFYFTRMKTSGRKLEKIVLESKFTTVLLSKAIDGKYVFETKAKNSTAKTPLGAFDEFEIENDICKVIKTLFEYEEGSEEVA